MTTDRGRLHALTTLLALREAGGFELPADVVTAAELLARVGAVTLPALPEYRIEQAADELLDALRIGRPVKLAEQADRLLEVTTAGARQQQAQMLVHNAAEQATHEAINTAADHAERIITAHLRPAFDALLAQAERHTAAMAGHPLEPQAIITAPAKVRTAWSELSALAACYGALREARRMTNTVAELQTAHDHAGEFAVLNNPHVLTGYVPGSTARPTQVDSPTEPVPLMLWLVGSAKPAGPWLPTVNEQDQAWWSAYGQGIEHRQALAVAARHPGAGGLLPVA